MNMDFFVAAPCMGGRGKRVVALSPLTVLLFAVQTHDVLYRVLESPATRHITLFLNHHLTGWFPLPFLGEMERLSSVCIHSLSFWQHMFWC
jgi:hypothetical protein